MPKFALALSFGVSHDVRIAFINDGVDRLVELCHVRKLGELLEVCLRFAESFFLQGFKFGDEFLEVHILRCGFILRLAVGRVVIWLFLRCRMFLWLVGWFLLREGVVNDRCLCIVGVSGLCVSDVGFSFVLDELGESSGDRGRTS